MAAHRERMLDQEVKNLQEAHRARQEELVRNAEVTIGAQRSRIVKEAEELSRTLKAEYETVTSEQEDFVEEQARENESE